LRRYANSNAHHGLQWPDEVRYTIVAFCKTIIVHPFLPIIAFKAPSVIESHSTRTLELIYLLKLFHRVVHVDYDEQAQHKSAYGGEVILYLNALQALNDATNINKEVCECAVSDSDAAAPKNDTGAEKETVDVNVDVDDIMTDFENLNVTTNDIDCTKTATSIPGFSKYKEEFSEAWLDVVAYCWMKPICFYKFISFINEHIIELPHADIAVWMEAYTTKGDGFVVMS
jgi:hypothetical protein